MGTCSPHRHRRFGRGSAEDMPHCSHRGFMENAAACAAMAEAAVKNNCFMFSNAYRQAHVDMLFYICGPHSPYDRASPKFLCESCGDSVGHCRCVVECECGSEGSKWSWQGLGRGFLCACDQKCRIMEEAARFSKYHDRHFIIIRD